MQSILITNNRDNFTKGKTSLEVCDVLRIMFKTCNKNYFIS